MSGLTSDKSHHLRTHAVRRRYKEDLQTESLKARIHGDKHKIMETEIPFNPESLRGHIASQWDIHSHASFHSNERFKSTMWDICARSTIHLRGRANKPQLQVSQKKGIAEYC